MNVKTQTCICVKHDQMEKEDTQYIGKIVLMLVAVVLWVGPQI